MIQSPALSTTKHALSITGLYYFSFILLGLKGALLGPTLPFLAENTGASLQTISLVFAATSLGYLLGALFVGRLYDRVAGHLLIAFMLVVVSSSLFLIPFASNLLLLLFIMMIAGVAASTTDIGGNTLLVWLHKDNVAPFMNGLHFAFGMGAFLAPIVVAQASLQTGNVSWSYWFAALLAIPLLLGYLRLASPQHQPKAKEKTSQVQRANGLVLLVAAFFFFYAGLEISFGNWVFTYATTLNIANDVWAAYLTSAYWGAFTLGRLLSIPLAVRLEPFRLMVLCTLSAALCLALMLIQPFAAWSLWLGSIGLGLTIAAIFPTMLSFAEQQLDLGGRLMSYFFVGASLGGMTVPWLIGQVFETVHPYMMMLVVSGCWLMMAGLLAVMGWRGHSRDT